MPQISDKDNMDSWMKKCVPYLVNKENKNQKQAVAQCINMFKQRKQKSKANTDPIWEDFEKETVYWIP